MAALGAELDEIRHLDDVELLIRKRATRRGCLTRINNAVRKMSSEGAASLNSRDLDRKKVEAEKHYAIAEAIQDRLDALVVTDEQLNQVEEKERETQSEEYTALMNALEAERDRAFLGMETRMLIDELQELGETTDPSTPTYQRKYQKTADRITEFKRRMQIYSTNQELKTYVQKVNKAVVVLDVIIADKLASSSTGREPTASPAAPVALDEPRRAAYRTNLAVDLPKFSGKPVEWKGFKELFTSVMKTAGVGMPQSEMKCHLLKAMEAPAAKRIVTNATGDLCYKQALEDLEETYGRALAILPHYINQLQRAKRCSYDPAGLSNFRETFESVVRGLKDCGCDTTGKLVAGVAMSCLDDKMSEEWSRHRGDDVGLPEIQDLLAFFKTRHLAMPQREVHVKHSNPTKSEPKKTPSAVVRVESDSSSQQCRACQRGTHPISRCRTFQDWSVEERRKAIKDWGYCFNCLSHNHKVKDCDSLHTCRRCKGSHHTFLHQETDSKLSAAAISEGHVLLTNLPQTTTILATAVFVAVNQGRQAVGRLLFDPGSSVTLITERMAQQLKLKRNPYREHFSTVAGDFASRHTVEVVIQPSSGISQVKLKVIAHVVKQLPSTRPPVDVEAVTKHKLLKGKPLADPAMGGEVDLLLSITDTNRCSKDVVVHNKDRTASVTHTSFGWVIGGAWPGTEADGMVLNVQVHPDRLEESLQRLFTLDSLPQGSPLSAINAKVVAQFKDTHQVTSEGRYAVAIPWKDPRPQLGTSREAALKRLRRHDNKLGNLASRAAYQEAVDEYSKTGHSELVPEEDLSKPPSQVFYLPHRGVYKESSTTTKLRVVFDGSAKSSTGVSVNDAMEAGPNLLPLLPSVMVRFRMSPIALSSDISKMFREIELLDRDRDYHRYLAKDNKGEVRDWRMRRLTFGIKASPYLATQVLRQLAEDHASTHTKAAAIVQQQFYVDDCLTGADSVDEAKQLYHQLRQLLKLAGMELRKWRSNSQEFLNSIPEELRENSDLIITDPSLSGKALGIHWDTQGDQLFVALPSVSSSEVVTKRIIASIAAQVFDVLGLYSPVTLLPKVLLQSLWKAGSSWDEPVPEHLEQEWRDWLGELHVLKQSSVPRRLITRDQPIQDMQLHGFSDASCRGYGVAVYLRVLYVDTLVTTALVFGKARVAPLKTVSIPRLELAAAHLLAKVMTMLAKELCLTKGVLYGWTDSMVVLAWLRRSPDELKVFEANRVAAIQEAMEPGQWRHVPTNDNPADLASRGCTSKKLLENSLWWNGPDWLVLSPTQWPNRLLQRQQPDHVKQGLKTRAVLMAPQPITNPLLLRWSSFNHLVRIVAWIKRFCHNSRTSRNQRKLAAMSVDEASAAKKTVLKLIQADVMPELIGADQPPKGHYLAKYQIQHKEGLILICSRVRSDNQPKTYIPLHLKSPGTRVMVDSLHEELHHAGTGTLLAHLAERFHIPNIKRYIKGLVRRCVPCQRLFGQPKHQLMGPLPSSRTDVALPFQSTGVDFAGPFTIRVGLPRSKKTSKAYLVVFICMLTKAVHLEVCLSLSTEAFTQTLRDFCNRRGTPTDLYSDNGSNFLGTRNEILQLQDFLAAKNTNRAINQLTKTKQFRWHLNPPRAPHMGGLWEGGVKAAKRILYTLLKDRIVTAEELRSLCIEAEAVLNSRPILEPASTDPDSGVALTPGHLLTGRNLTSPPPMKVDVNSKSSTLRRWNFIARLRHDFWQQWSSRYLQSLAKRQKWQLPTRDFRVGDVVIIKDDILRQARRWPLAVITQVYPGPDGHVRTVTLRCGGGATYTRATNRLVLLIAAVHKDRKTPVIASPLEDV